MTDLFVVDSGVTSQGHNMQMGFINIPTVTEDENEYTHLQKYIEGYERLCVPVKENQTNVYLELLDVIDSYPAPSTSTETAVSMESDDAEGRYLHPQSRSPEYLDLMDDRVSPTPRPVTLTNQAESIETDGKYTGSKTQSSLYEEIPAFLVNTEDDSGNIILQGLCEGYVDNVDNSDSLSHSYESPGNQEVSKETHACYGNSHVLGTKRPVSVRSKDESASTNPKRNYERYVASMDYSDSFANHSDKPVDMEDFKYTKGQSSEYEEIPYGRFFSGCT